MPFNPLDALFGQAGVLPAVNPENIINVTSKGGQELGPDEVPDLYNANVLLGAQDAAESAPEHKGMFGTKGTLRDVLGTLGDAFLTQSGNQQIYAPQRERERRSDAMAGFTDDPRAAVERLAAGGFSQDAQAINKQRLATQGSIQQAESDQRMAQQEAEVKAAQQAYDNRNESAELLYTAMGGAKSEEEYQRIRPILEVIKSQGGLGEEYYIPETFDEGMAAAYTRMGMNPSQQMSAERGDRQLGVSQQNADTNRIRANKAPSGRAPQRPSNPTRASEEARVVDKINRGEELGAGDQVVLDRMNRTGSSSNRRGAPGAAISGLVVN